MTDDPDRFSGVLAGLSWPASTWQLWAHADAYGADAHTRVALGRLPAATYADLDAVLTALQTFPTPRSSRG